MQKKLFQTQQDQNHNLEHHIQNSQMMIQLLHFQCWIESRYQKSALLSIKLGKRTPTFVKNYYPGTRIHIFDTVMKSQLPTVEISFNQCQQKCFELQNFLGHEIQPHVEIMQDSRILFTFQLLTNTEKLYDRYCQQKSDSQKHYLCQGVKDFIRSQQEFLAQYQRNQQIDQIRQLQAQESRIERDLCEEIMNTKKYSLSIGKIIFMALLFLFVGFLLGRHDDSIKGDFITNLFYPMKNQKKKVKITKLKDKNIVPKNRHKQHQKKR